MSLSPGSPSSSSSSSKPKIYPLYVVLLLLLPLPLLLHSPHLAHLPRLLRDPYPRLLPPPVLSEAPCILYDAPPHTGERAVRKFLRDCLVTKQITLLRYPPKTSDDDIHDDLSLRQPPLSHFTDSRHPALYVEIQQALHDLPQVVKTCDPILYLTSARSMTSRLISRLHELPPALSFSSSPTAMSSTDVRNMLLQQLPTIESQYHAHPYFHPIPHSDNHIPNPIQLAPSFSPPLHRHIPNYVIRDTAFADDLRALLVALACDNANASLPAVLPLPTVASRLAEKLVSATHQQPTSDHQQEQLSSSSNNHNDTATTVDDDDDDDNASGNNSSNSTSWKTRLTADNLIKWTQAEVKFADHRYEKLLTIADANNVHGLFIASRIQALHEQHLAKLLPNSNATHQDDRLPS